MYLYIYICTAPTQVAQAVVSGAVVDTPGCAAGLGTGYRQVTSALRNFGVPGCKLSQKLVLSDFDWHSCSSFLLVLGEHGYIGRIW